MVDGGGNFITRRHSAGDALRSTSSRMTTYSPPSIPGHECQEFQAPEGIYHLANQAFFRSLTPNFSIGTTASLVSIKYKETTFNNLQRYEPQPGARSYRRIFGSTSSSTSHDNNNNNSNNSDEDSRTPSLSSSSSSYNNNNNNNNSSNNNNNTTTSNSNNNSNNNSNSNRYLHPHHGHHYNNHHGGIPVSPLSPSIPEGQAVNSNSIIPKLGSSLEGPSFLSTSPPLPPNMISSSLSTSTTNSISHSNNNYIHSNSNNSNNNSNNINNSNGNSNNGGFSFLSRNNTVSSRRKPRTNITKTSSSFVNKIVTNNQLAKILVARTSEDTNLFYNCGNSFVWIDAFGHPKEPLSRIIFAKANPTAHDVNLLTRGSDHLDIIIGFSSGDIVWFDPLCNKYGRINKGGIMNSSAITMIKWLQGSESLFMAAFADGTMMIFDKDKEDEPFHPLATTGLSSTTPPMLNRRKHYSTGSLHIHHNNTSNTTMESQQKTTFRVTKPSPKISMKCNPVTHWTLSSKPIKAFAFSPDCQHVAVVGLDGLLRVINFVQETLYDIYQSYYGGMNCVAWSPDGRYILTGGEDDLVTIWAFREQRIIARCQGHSSYVTGVAFDSWRCDERVYRFASVGEDAKLILWDFSVNALHRPKMRTTTGGRHRGNSVSSQHNGPPANMLNAIQDQGPTVHPIQSKNQVAFLQPTMVKAVHADPCVGVYFREDVIVTTDRKGRVGVWQRPPPSAASSQASSNLH
ncbi:hypothetical protein INT45_008435 [Circinella minor]|uniref:WD40 repeat-like protein n=1 Tax=Circinella minor TaxID=1195481 RepID=A0A8H7SFA9_9FUNG|nr:hypothetical protein INT45_008435 [Circinella minor]